MGLDDRIKTLEAEMKEVKLHLAEQTGALKLGKWLTPLLVVLATIVANRLFPPQVVQSAQAAAPAITSPAGHP